ncbi:galactose oxidase kelch beta-propeller [Stemphylium lycopersici]|nr:galactose oxidase kelch beta-propeller [Stemphylium lycopersici]RAR11586.1 galactose oxidase kelch beta-propeller [Stemphylium lycopersici]
MTYLQRGALVFLSILTLALSQQNDPIKQFCRRWGHATAQIDSRLYLDGGMVGSVPFSSNHTNTWLLSSDLNTSTADAGMPAQSANLSKPGNIPSVSGGYAWADDTNKCFYSFGGEYPQGVSPTDFSMWTYDVLLNQWNSTDTSGEKDIQRVSFGAGTQVEERGLGFYFGGWVSNQTTIDWEGPPMATNGLIQFDMSTGDLTNTTGPDDIGRAEGQLLYLPVSDRGVLIYFGGIEDPYRNGSFDAIIRIYDMASSKWYTQTASGEIPSSRRQFCADVTWPDDQSSFNIYLYGGFGFGENPAYDEVYILSIPSFTWIKVFPLDGSDSTPSEFGHGGCSANVINRAQMLVIGGWFPIYDKCDVPEGQGQHNMVLGYNGGDAKLWDKFQPKLDDYVVPSPIIAAIGGAPTGGATKTSPEQWGHPDLATYYTLKPTFPPRSATRPLPSATESLSSGDSEKTNVGAIAGGVVGGVVGLIVILCLILFCLHRRKKALKEKRTEDGGDFGNAHPPSLPLPPAELASTVPHEMSASNANKYVSIHNQANSIAMAQYPGYAQQHSHSASHDYNSPLSAQGPPSYGQAPPYTSPVEAPINQISSQGGQFHSDPNVVHNSPSTTWGTQTDYPQFATGHEGQYSYPTPTTPRQSPRDAIQQQVPIYYPQSSPEGRRPVQASHGRTAPKMFNIRSIILLAISYVVIPRLTFLPQNVHTLLIIFGPFLLPRMLDWINVARASSRSVPVRATPQRVQYALNLLFFSAVVCLALSFSRYAPENIFLKTQSHIRTETSVLFARLRHMRPLTDEDEALRTKFSWSVRNKLLYLAYGPDTLLNCVWCTTADGSDQQNYFLYPLPKIITPHIFQLAVLGLATSSLVGAEGSRFRTHATIAGLLLMVVEVWYMSTYDISLNKRAKFVQDLDSAHWRVRFLRYIAFALVDMGLAFVLWATSTNRWLAKPVSIAERIETTTRTAEDTFNKMRALALLTNSVNRDSALRGVREEYWTTEGQVTAEVVQDEVVTEQINAAISKLDFNALEGRVGEVADGILRGIDSLRAGQILSAGQMNQAPSSPAS